jgi:FtsP/CotA-like multicopper oxidase with cupredoxin domain
MLTRRSALVGAFSSCVALPHRLWAQPTSAALGEKPDAVTILRVERRNIEVNGRAASALGIRQPDGAPGLVTEVGRRFRVRVDNALDAPTLIHWHGMAPPWRQDGVPGISGPPISPGASAEYDFPLRFGGTFWMHSHEGLQEQSLLAAPLIIRDARNPPGQQEATIMLADFSFTPAAQIYEELRKKHATLGLRAKTGEVRRPDLNDVSYDAFLANDRTLADPETIRVEPGEKILLRIINSSCMSAYHVDLGALSGELVAVDGFSVRPIRGQRFPIAVAQRLDILVKVPRGPAAFPLLAIVEGERRQAGVILVAGRGSVTRFPEIAPTPSPALSLNLESRLRATKPLAKREPDRIHHIDLTGDMNGYVWSINGVVWNKEIPPLLVAEGERVEIVLNNKTLMSHPMHLHGHQFQVMEIDGRRFPGAVRDTVMVTPGRRVVIAFDANNPGWWAFHCHLLYHQAAGMFATVRYV